MTLAMLDVALGAACVGAEKATPPAPAAATPAVVTPANALDDSEPPHTIFACLGRDSVVFTDVRVDSVSGDTVGTWISLWRSGGGVDGASYTAGDPGNAVPLSRVQLTADDSIALDMPHIATADTARFIGRVDCGRLWGRQRASRESPTRFTLYRRLRDSTVREP